jgi:hypothetical protein
MPRRDRTDFSHSRERVTTERLNRPDPPITPSSDLTTLPTTTCFSPSYLVMPRNEASAGHRSYPTSEAVGPFRYRAFQCQVDPSCLSMTNGQMAERAEGEGPFRRPPKASASGGSPARVAGGRWGVLPRCCRRAKEGPHPSPPRYPRGEGAGIWRRTPLSGALRIDLSFRIAGDAIAYQRSG